MFVAFSSVFVEDPKIIFVYNFTDPLISYLFNLFCSITRFTFLQLQIKQDYGTYQNTILLFKPSLQNLKVIADCSYQTNMQKTIIV